MFVCFAAVQRRFDLILRSPVGLEPTSCRSAITPRPFVPFGCALKVLGGGKKNKTLSEIKFYIIHKNVDTHDRAKRMLWRYLI